ncbi:MAG: ABC transporter ATP-binding protein [Deltaproteobacteria bacterium]|nr:ABC transporter ATP-binding protein [Deltaproteobacteria bacterium]MBW1737350.1 ABC transporter ATP-binding protein [Deltaproteobacteria bacterium]MBW1909558.1 ABC transporter ATP-binding protein [Deltaproteobacteria bacterium]MBW2033070.1 ABC transporter ATP-binding protein [Deltaproteobacteria bacterium]MBW2114334.1 ABC transporter ATP-binding protein [Deltaproteobacteria bacterium]
MLSLEGVYKSFTHHGNQIEVLKGVDLIVKQGDSLAVMGASGVGKSTLLNIMGSLDPPTEGVVKFGDKNVYQMNEAVLSRFRNREIGFVFQFHHLLPEFSALENAMMPALIARYPRKRAAEMAREVLEKVGLGRRLTHRAGELSGGEQQRVAIARSLTMRPKLILADEPTGNLDWVTGQEIADLMLRLNREEGVAMVIATHNSRLAERMSRHMEIVDGRIQ